MAAMSPAAPCPDLRAAVSQYLKAMRDCGFASLRGDGARRVYAMDATPMKQVEWISQFRGLWIGKLDALVTEATQGKKSSKARTGHGS